MQPHTETNKQPYELRVSSPSFGQGAAIPIEHTGDGADVAPELAWTPAPPGTRSIAVLVEDPDAPDPDAPTTTFTHWIVTGIPATATSLRGGRLPAGAVHGRNDFGNASWNGPRPPIGRHRYFFRVYALDTALTAPGITRLELFAAIKGHILAEGELVATYAALKEHRSAARGGERKHPH